MFFFARNDAGAGLGNLGKAAIAPRKVLRVSRPHHSAWQAYSWRVGYCPLEACADWACSRAAFSASRLCKVAWAAAAAAAAALQLGLLGHAASAAANSAAVF